MCPRARLGSRFRPDQCDLVEIERRRSWSRIVSINSQWHALRRRQAAPRITAFGARVRPACVKGGDNMRLARMVALALAASVVIPAFGGPSNPPPHDTLHAALI